MTDPATAARSDWRPWLTDQFGQLGRWFQGRFVVELGPDDQLVSAQAMLDAASVERLLTDAYESQDYADLDLSALPHAAAEHLKSGGTGRSRGMSIAASRVTRHYSAPFTTIALVGLAAGVAFDLAPRQCSMVMASGVPFRLVLGTPGEPPDLLAVLDGVDAPADVPRVGTVTELRDRVWRNVYAEHLEPVFNQMAAVAKIAPALMWTNAAEWVAMVHDGALEYLDAETAAPIAAEAEALLAAASLPGLADDGNPLQGKLEWLPVGDEQQLVQTRNLCCLTYMLADRFGRLCQSCPYLPAEDRLALVRERHGVPMGVPSGAAEQRSIAQGLQRPSIAALLKPMEGSD